MPSTLTRYLLRRWLTPFLGALLFYGLLLISWETVALSREIFSQGAALRWMMPLLLLSLPESLGMVLPMAAVLGGLLGTQQLMEGSELVAAQGLGAGRRTWLVPWSILGAGLLVLASVNAHVLVPQAAGLQRTLRHRMAEEALAKFLRPGSPPWHPPGSPDSAFWLSGTGQFHVMEATADGVQHLTASRVAYTLGNTPAGQVEVQLHLEDLRGASYPGTGGSPVHLKEAHHLQRFSVPSGPRLLAPLAMRYAPSGVLLRAWRDPQAPTSRRRESAVELGRRLTLPLASVSLLLLGISLGFGHARFYRGGAIVKSLGVILVYYFLMKSLENLVLDGKLPALGPTLLLPFLFLGAGWFILNRRLSPHRASNGPGVLFNRLGRLLRLAPLQARLARARAALAQWIHRQGNRRGVLRHWATLAWWRSWGMTMGSLLVLDLLVEFSSLAGDLTRNHIRLADFLLYWVWSLPPFLEVALPVSFLLGTLLVLSEGGLTREWLAIRAGGVSLVQWLWASRYAWGAVVLATFLLQAGLSPLARTRARSMYHRILRRPPPQGDTSPWMYLGSTGVLWHLSPEARWGFPLKPPFEAPVLLRWKPGQERVEALPWGGMALVPGPPALTLFPDRALLKAPSASEAVTWDLVEWQRWAPDPERAYLLWNRLLGWVSGPLLVMALLSYALPGPRQGRGQAIGAGLVGGLLFLGLQTLFGGAARAAELPAAWGFLAPCLLLAGFGLMRLSRLRT